MSALPQTAGELRRRRRRGPRRLDPAGDGSRSRRLRSSRSFPSCRSLAAPGCAREHALPGAGCDGARADGRLGGPPSLGTGAFMAIGAFTSALLVARSGWPVEPAALAGAAAALVARSPLGRRRALAPQAFVAVSTWLLAWLVWLFLLAFPSVSGGSQGLIASPEDACSGSTPPRPSTSRWRLRCWRSPHSRSAAARRGARGSSCPRSVRIRRSQPRSGWVSPRAASPRLPRPRRSPGSPGRSRFSFRRSPTRTPTTRFLSFKLLVAVLLGGAAATLGPLPGSPYSG